MLLMTMLTGCSPSFSGLEAAPLDDMTTVIEVRWDRSDADRVWVEYGEDLASVAPEVEGDADTHRVLIAGHPQLTEVRWRPVAEIDGRRVEGEEQVTETGLLPSGLPSFAVIAGDPSLHDGGFLLTCSVGPAGGVVILNRDAEIVWYRQVPAGLVVSDIAPDPAGGVWMIPVDEWRETDLGALVHVGLDGVETRYVDAPFAHHVFEHLGGRSFAWLSIDVRDNEQGDAVVGDAILTVDDEAEVSTLFSVWDVMDWAPGPSQESEFWPQGLDWTHGNGLHHSEARGTLTYSSRNLSLLFEVDAASGALLRTIGKEGDIAVEPAWEAFSFQHAPSWTDEGTLLVFDSRAPGGVDGPSRIVELAVDEALGVATSVWEWNKPHPSSVDALGDAVRLDNGNTLTSWGTTGELIEVHESNEIAWHAVGGVGVIVGPVFALPSL